MRAKMLLCHFAAVWLLGSAFSTTLAADGPATFKVSEFTFTRPGGWTWVETTSPMRQAQLAIGDPKAEASGEVIFFYFGPGQGGGVQANVDRWFGMFREPRDQIGAKRDKVLIGKHAVTFVEAQGTFMSGPPGGAKTPRPNFRLLGAIIESGAGNVFVRATGPKELLEEAKADFRRMIESGLQ